MTMEYSQPRGKLPLLKLKVRWIQDPYLSTRETDQY